jgi:integrase
MQKVWYRSSNSWWYATVLEAGRQKQLKLCRGPNTRDGKQQAERLLVEELVGRDVTEDAKVPRWLTVGHVLTGFLAHSKQEHEPATHRWYKDLLTSFSDRFGKLRVLQLRKRHVIGYVKKRGYNPTSQNKAIGAIKRAFNWAVEEEHIPKSPVAHVRKPRPLTRDRILEPGERELILASITDEAFRNYVTALLATGCRPGEIARVSKADCNVERGVWVMVRHKTAKKTGKPRVVYLTPAMVALTRTLCERHPDGPIFRNRRGKPWSGTAVRQRFQRLREKYPQLKGVIAYTLRSNYATVALESGIPDATVAELLGHSGTATLHRYYARLSRKIDHLRDAAIRAMPQEAGVDQHGIVPETPGDRLHG